MYFVNTLIFLSSTLAAAHDAPHSCNTPTPTLLDPSLATPTPSSAIPTTTVTITITHTLSPSNPSPTSPSTTSPHFAIPPLATNNRQAGADWPASALDLLPIAAASQTAKTPTDMRMFTLDKTFAAATSVPFVGHYTLATSIPRDSQSPHASSSGPSSGELVTAPSGELLVSQTPTSTTAQTESSYSPATTRAESTYQAPTPFKPTSQSAAADGTVSMLPGSSPGPGGSLPGFDWPAASPATNALPTSGAAGGSDEGGDGDGEDGIVWAGVDNAIPAQMHERSLQAHTLPYLSPPLQSKSAAVRRVQRVWARNEALASVVPDGESKRDADANNEKRECQACGEEGKVLCRGDVAIGICKGGCVEMRFFGRGRGNGCEDD